MSIEQLEEEIFCLNFEVKALSDLLIRSEAERWVPGFLYPVLEQEHLARYHLVKSFVEDKKVLDLACGAGFGSYLLSKEGKAKQVDGGDINELSLRYAMHRYTHPGLNYFKANAEKFCKEEFYDVVVSFETIEHLHHPEQFLENVLKSLVQGGKFFVSTPIAIFTNNKPFNPYHIIEWSFDDFQQTMVKYFKIDQVFLQNVVTKRDTHHIPERIYKKVKKLLGFTKPVIEDSRLIPYTGEWENKKFHRGYQLLICSKK